MASLFRQTIFRKGGALMDITAIVIYLITLIVLLKVAKSNRRR